MALLYTYNREEDIDKILVEQDTTLILTYLSGNNSNVVVNTTIKADNTFIFPINKDGNYRVLLSAEGETSETFDFFVKKHLEKSIITDAVNLLCNKCDCSCNCGGCNSDNNLCITKEAKLALVFRGIFVKLLSFQHVYLYTYNTDYTNLFNTYIKNGINLNTCHVQTNINAFLYQECLTGQVKDVTKLFKIYLLLYWYAMYKIELQEATETQEFITNKYKADKILNCICDLCVDLTALDANAPTATDMYYWQYNDLTTNIGTAPSINQAFLNAQDTATLSSALQGRNFSFSNTGRIGLAIPTTQEDRYRILNALNVDITETVFDTYYNSALNIQIYISKNYYSPSNFYYKLIDTNE